MWSEAAGICTRGRWVCCIGVVKGNRGCALTRRNPAHWIIYGPLTISTFRLLKPRKKLELLKVRGLCFKPIELLAIFWQPESSADLGDLVLLTAIISFVIYDYHLELIFSKSTRYSEEALRRYFFIHRNSPLKQQQHNVTFYGSNRGLPFVSLQLSVSCKDWLINDSPLFHCLGGFIGFLAQEVRHFYHSTDDDYDADDEDDDLLAPFWISNYFISAIFL